MSAGKKNLDGLERGLITRDVTQVGRIMDDLSEVPGSDFRNMFWGKGLGVVWTEM